MRHDMAEAEYIAYLAKRSQEPDIQALVKSWPKLEPDELALIARVFAGTAQAQGSTLAGEAAA